MDRRAFLQQSLVGAAAAPTLGAVRGGHPQRRQVLANEYTVLWKASDPTNEIGYCPALARLPNGRLIGCMLHAGPKSDRQREWTVKVYTSDDRGHTWNHRTDVAMIDCFPFVAGSSVYVIGGRYDLTLVKSDDGREITVSLQEAPSGEPMLYVSLPGGQVSFHIAYDEKTRRFWMISSQATDSMRRVELLEPKRYSMPNQERHRLALHFSKNCIDWCFAGLVAAVDDVGQSRHGGNMVIDGDDLHILMRSADANATNAHNSNLISFHTVKNFRDLEY